ncbi:MAG TPA: nucleotide exchange factor GrpE [Bacteroidetes bacterium]|jgi:molecular chaperone GrpE|nr:nucleotide exchange factor GrpE [Bacteroidota bacterium]
MAEEILEEGDTNPTEHPNEEAAETPKRTSTGGLIDTEPQMIELQQKLEAAQKLADSYKDQLLRKAAEFDNFKKRTEAEYVNLVKNANEGLITSLIPILDDFTRSMKSGREVKDHESFFKGVELIYNKFVRLLESHGLIPFESVGKPFDVDYHDALLQMPRSDVPPHTVVEEIERGYKLFEKIIRHAKVIVSAEPQQQSDGPSDGKTQGAEKN